MRPDSRRVHYYNVRSGLICNQRLISAWVRDLTYQLPGLAGCRSMWQGLADVMPRYRKSRSVVALPNWPRPDR